MNGGKLAQAFDLIFFALVPSMMFGQDSLVRASELTYKSDFERATIQQYLKAPSRESLLPLFLSTDPAMTAETYSSVNSRLVHVQEDLKTSGLDKKKPDKKVKLIYDQVHNTFLRKYELENRFPEIFTSGQYNCVTATALYSLFFDNLGVPYSIKEEPTHVYLVAYPNVSNILVETTTPLFGYLQFDQNFKQNYIKNLTSQKIIGSSEAQTSGTEELFNKYYFKNENIDSRKLVGIHYMNDALFRMDHNDLINALDQAKKAYFFYPSSRCEYILASFSARVLTEGKLKPLQRAALIGEISRYTNQGITNDMIKGEFTTLTSEVLLRENNKLLYKECYETLVAKINDFELKNEIAYIYNYENGRIYYNQGNYVRAKSFFGKALEIHPHEVDLGLIFTSAISQTFRNENNSWAALDTLKHYQKKFPALNDNNNFTTMLATANLLCCREEYKKGNVIEGEKYRLTFESLIKENSNLSVPHDAIGSAYSAMCVHYFKRGQKAKARGVLNRGLELAPDSYELRVRQQMLN